MNRYLSIVVLAAAVLAAGSACAQTVQKCVSPDGRARYQSAPCAAHERVAGTWDAAPDPPLEPVPAARSRPLDRPRIARPRSTRGPARTARQVSPPDACAQARRERDDGERRAGLKRTYALLSSLQARGFEACR